jgi:hypothetical protein
MPLRHEGATVLLASRLHQSAHIAVCCVAADQHDAFASMMRKERVRVSVESFLRSDPPLHVYPPHLLSTGLGIGAAVGKRALLSGFVEVKTSEEDCSRQAKTAFRRVLISVHS